MGVYDPHGRLSGVEEICEIFLSDVLDAEEGSEASSEDEDVEENTVVPRLLPSGRQPEGTGFAAVRARETKQATERINTRIFRERKKIQERLAIERRRELAEQGRILARIDPMMVHFD